MRRPILLVLVVALALLIFAPVALAHDDATDDRGMAHHDFDDNVMAGPTTASPTATATATASSTATASPTARMHEDRDFNRNGAEHRDFDHNAMAPHTTKATPTATATATATSNAGSGGAAAASVGKMLPRTGGVSVTAPLVSGAALVLLVGRGMLAAVLRRRYR
jgi:hypothetical protein